MIIGWDFGTKNDYGLYDTGMCQECGKRRLHTVVSLHKHFIISLIPVYISNKYYRKCDVCGKETLLDKKEAKQRIQQIAEVFPSKEQGEAFFATITDAINNNAVICMENQGKFIVDEDKKNSVKDIIWEQYKDRYQLPKIVYDEFVEYYTDVLFSNMLSANVLLEELENTDTVEEKLKQIKDLYDKKLISETEYQEKKGDILNGI